LVSSARRSVKVIDGLGGGGRRNFIGTRSGLSLDTGLCAPRAVSQISDLEASDIGKEFDNDRTVKSLVVISYCGDGNSSWKESCDNAQFNGSITVLRRISKSNNNKGKIITQSGSSLRINSGLSGGQVGI